ncbi:hypothetical protein KZJ38_17080 [Paraburkholderia edwinii]|jgi:hypothetical protein|uniref:Uncharacterized protein n=1 Tax=Paraburkholderia edwinii TaxID=2861782 RepID=A0ABX8UH68_9BURK|nr:hypothetical protein [Paraburkholderia edwinii]QYD67991.1 hypothetical protein KZJ38_17080 [Paraburkholderia edwinii]
MNPARRPEHLDDEARAELLTYLVAGQLVARARTGVWLETTHLVESAQIWLASNGANCSWFERAHLARVSAELAPSFLNAPALSDAATLAQLFTDGGRLDYRSPIVGEMFSVCQQLLRRSIWKRLADK